jgi:exopolysaccharide biosynthesis protein
MQERHPRAAVGWNDEFYFLVQVDGRQKGVAAGMTLAELASYLVRLGCKEAMNLDGGGSATLWYAGTVRNFLCDGYEREVANCLVVVKESASETVSERRGP